MNKTASLTRYETVTLAMRYPSYPKYKESGVAWLGEVRRVGR